jgi:hypothetical protein
VIKFASDLRQVGGFLRVLRFPPTIQLTDTMKNPPEKKRIKMYFQELWKTQLNKAVI